MAQLGDDQLQEMREALQEARSAADRARRRVEQVRVSVQDRERLLSATVGGRGELLDLTFHGDAYRDLAPAELAALIVRTVGTARAGATRRAMKGLDALLGDVPQPADLASRATSAEELVDGIAEWVTGRTAT